MGIAFVGGPEGLVASEFPLLGFCGGERWVGGEMIIPLIDKGWVGGWVGGFSFNYLLVMLSAHLSTSFLQRVWACLRRAAWVDSKTSVRREKRWSSIAITSHRGDKHSQETALGRTDFV